ncbi:RSP_2647 family RNA methyltransferase [Oceanibium sediminis]|uniref:RSP_2647 family RNA methyltransferase n=1 Tax=Oceanibium sediminis TaxID=2026339 RepID=UPI0018E54648|nr:class I SAM-dependent rRNA methyltransferase [Oceanibium sediminis]
MTRPTIRLRPKKPAQPLRFGAPWAYADTLVIDRRARALAPGTIVTLEDGERQPLGTAAFNATSKISIRMLDTDPAAEIDQAWLESRLQTALTLREKLFDAPFYRLVHAEADGLPGVVIDRFGDSFVIQPNAAWADAMIDTLTAALIAVTGARAIYKNASGRTRALEGLDDTSSLLHGTIDGPVDVPMNGAAYRADLLGGQKTGLFYDQRPNHALAARLAKGGSVLDVFAHVGGFSLAALAAGATSALAVDASAPALALAEEGAQASGTAPRFTTREGDAFQVMDALAGEGRTFDTVICDPPAFAPAKPALEAGLRAYERVARLGAQLVAPGGTLVLCSCSHAADLDAFRTASLKGIGKAGRRAQIVATGGAGPDHPVHPYLAATSYLKAVFLRLMP